MIKEGYADVMLAGGADSLSPSVYAGFNVLQALNPAPCSPYNHKYGLSLGEGAAFVVLEALDSALARNARIYAEVCGYGLSSDAYHETAPEPQGLGIQLAVRFALASSGVRADEIDYINTHGTGTKANDAAELHGLRQLFGEQKFQDIWVSSSKVLFWPYAWCGGCNRICHHTASSSGRIASGHLTFRIAKRRCGSVEPCDK